MSMEDVTIRFGSDSHQSNDVRGAQYSVSLVWREKKKKRRKEEKKKRRKEKETEENVRGRNKDHVGQTRNIKHSNA